MRRKLGCSMEELFFAGLRVCGWSLTLDLLLMLLILFLLAHNRFLCFFWAKAWVFYGCLFDYFGARLEGSNDFDNFSCFLYFVLFFKEK